jgi:hypothetical protein
MASLQFHGSEVTFVQVSIAVSRSDFCRGGLKSETMKESKIMPPHKPKRAFQNFGLQLLLKKSFFFTFF